MAACSSELGNRLNNPETCYVKKQSQQKELRTNLKELPLGKVNHFEKNNCSELKHTKYALICE